jgi:hypothetical protein
LCAIGVRHHLQGRAAKHAILAAIAERLKPSAPFDLAGNHGANAGNARLLSGWRRRWRTAGGTEEEIEAKIGKILQGADPPDCDRDVETMLAEAGFCAPELFCDGIAAIDHLTCPSPPMAVQERRRRNRPIYSDVIYDDREC